MNTRRQIITLLGGAAAWPVMARAQQSVIPVVGYLHPGTPSKRNARALADGLKENGYIEGRNVRVEYRWARGHYDSIPKLAAELIRLPVAALAVQGTAVRLVVQSMVKRKFSVPIVFSYGGDPVAEGLVASFNMPGGSVTGVTSISREIEDKRLQLLRDLPGTDVVAILVNPNSPMAAAQRLDAERTALALGQRLTVLTASNGQEIDAAFANISERRIGALAISTDTFYFGQMQVSRMAELAMRYRVAAIGPLREFAESGGLMSYGANIYEVNRQAAVYLGKVLRGTKPSELPVLQPTRFELVINLKAAKAFGLTMPNTLLALADEVIE